MSDLKYMLENWKRENESLVRENERLRNRKDELIKEKVGVVFQLTQLEKEKKRREEKYEETAKKLTILETILEAIYDILVDLVDHIDNGIKRGEYRSTSKIHDFQQKLLKAMKPYADHNEIDLPIEIEVEED